VNLDGIDRNAVLAAMAEHDQLGEAKFLKKYGYGRAHAYWLVHAGQRYASKAIVGVAHRHVVLRGRSLGSDEFSGGARTVQAKLEALGFAVETGPSGALMSRQLVVGQPYTRNDLKSLFDVTDATIKNGIFHPRATASVWLFVTEKKTSDRTQYQDRLEGDVLHMQGQSAGRTDRFITDHVEQGLELLVFHRRSRHEHPGDGFRYLGPFSYVSHSGARPTNFVLRRCTEANIDADETTSTEFNPNDVADGRRRIQRTIAERRGQRTFRQALLNAYGQRCAISGCDVLDILEAAHIYPYRGEQTNHVTNGILLRADLHTLFDCGLIGIDPETFQVLLAPKLRNSEYGQWHSAALRQPDNLVMRPSKEALKAHLSDSAAAKSLVQKS
jgi:putative restriction endonuclease